MTKVSNEQIFKKMEQIEKSNLELTHAANNSGHKNGKLYQQMSNESTKKFEIMDQKVDKLNEKIDRNSNLLIRIQEEIKAIPAQIQLMVDKKNEKQNEKNEAKFASKQIERWIYAIIGFVFVGLGSVLFDHLIK